MLDNSWTTFSYVVALLAGLVLVMAHLLNKAKKEPHHGKHWEREGLKAFIAKTNINLPAMIVDLDVFESNCNRIVNNIRLHNRRQPSERNHKKLRVATKSVRCVSLLHRIQSLAGDILSGWMCYSVHEVALLAEHGLKNHFYVAYPTVQRADLEQTVKLIQKGVDITLTVDSPLHVSIIDSILGDLGAKVKVKLSIDLDVSFKVFIAPRLGAHRSRISSIDDFKAVNQAISRSKWLRLTAAMGYEAHVAGLPDEDPHVTIPNIVVQIIKTLFQRKVVSYRQKVADYCQKNNLQLDFFNGSGSGNYEQALDDPSITEVAVGSGFLQAQLFDYFKSNKCHPALVFALQVTRRNDEYICCQSGGFIASGGCSLDKQPSPFTAANGVQLIPLTDEGFGEVQTPLIVSGNSNIQIGEPVFFRPAKSGEIAEHFTHYYIKKDYEIVEKAPTYRGMGRVFY